MHRSHRLRATRAAAVAVTCAHVVGAQTSDACGVDVVEVVPTAPAWRDAIAMLHADLGKLAHAECVEGTLFVGPADDKSLTLRIRLVDGREATRVVARPSALSAIAFGLVVAAPTPSAPVTTSPTATPPAPAQSRQTIAAPPPSPAPTELGLDVELSAGARIAFPTNLAMPDFNLRADVRAADWIVVGDVRWAPIATLFGAPVGGYAYSEVALALGGGRRFHVDKNSFELTATATLVLMSEDGDAPVEEGGSPSELRLGFCGRVLFPWGTRVKPTLTIDGEIAPTALATPIRVGADLPPLPTWTLGVRVGVLGELL